MGAFSYIHKQEEKEVVPNFWYYDPRSLMFLALHLTPGILDPLTPDFFTHSFGDDPKYYTMPLMIAPLGGGGGGYGLVRPFYKGYG